MIAMTDMNSANNVNSSAGSKFGVAELLESLGNLNVEIDKNGKLVECLNDYEANGDAKKLLSSLSRRDLDVSILDNDLLQTFRDEVQGHLASKELHVPNNEEDWTHDTDWIPASIVDTDEPGDFALELNEPYQPSNNCRGTAFEAALLHPDKVYPVSPEPIRAPIMAADNTEPGGPPASVQTFTSAAGNLAQTMAQSEQSRRYIDRFLKKTQRRSSLTQELKKSRMQVRQLIHDDLEFTKQQLLEQMEATAQFMPRRRHSLTLSLKNTLLQCKPNDWLSAEEEDYQSATARMSSPPEQAQAQGAPLSPESLALARKGGRRRRFSCTG